MPFYCFIAFSKHVNLCFRPLSGFVTHHVKKAGRGGGGIYWNRRVLVSVSSNICLPGFVQKISSEQLNLLYSDLIWWCIVLSLCVMHKNWDAIFKVKVTIRAYRITIWLFQLYQCYDIVSLSQPPHLPPLFFFFFLFCNQTLLVDHQSLNILWKCVIVV